MVILHLSTCYNMGGNLCEALCIGCECAYICCLCCGGTHRGGPSQPEPVVVTQVQPVVVAASPVGQGNYVAGIYVKSPTGEVQFVPAAQPVGYNSASLELVTPTSR
ncbi:hypothetical protein AC1031_022121 [Aphanomyces cochlioides]|nr:hypothetical protein AC1031_022121 [Aphanomyces cochlioides]